MPKGWHELGSLPTGAKLLDDYGDVTSRWGAARDAGVELPATWVLDRKRFRRAADAVLPPGHRVAEILADRSSVRRASKAARAFERLRRATQDLALPPWSAETETIVLWTSPVVRPRGIRVLELGHQVQVEPDADEVRAAIGRLWAEVYLEQTLREIAINGVKRIEVVVGLTILTPTPPHARDGGGPAQSNDAVQATWTALLTDQERPPTGFALPGASKDCAPESPLAGSLATHSAGAWRSVLRRHWGRGAAAIVQRGPGRWQWQAEAVLRLLERSAGIDERVLRSLAGLPGDERVGRARRWGMRTAVLGSRELVQQGKLFAQVAEHERHCRDVLGGLSELDLAVLPDDGLKRTVEDARGLQGRTAELLAEASFSAELMVALCEELAPASGLLVDAGLDALPWVTLLADWEERLEVVRNDAAFCEALTIRGAPGGWARLPDGPGRRALQGLASSHGFLARRHADPACPRLGEELGELVELARTSLGGAGDVYGRCREARFAADRILAVEETTRGQLFTFGFGTLRGLARDAILLRERVRLLELHVGALFRRIAVDVDRRLRRLEPGLPPGAAFDCTTEELLEAVDLRGSSLFARVAWRRAQTERHRLRPEAWYPAAEGRSMPLSGSTCEHPVAVEALDGLWLLRIAYVPGVLVRWASRGDSVAVLARALGVPAASTLGEELTPAEAHGDERFAPGWPLRRDRGRDMEHEMVDG